jgi:hypothetical protein
VSIFSFGFHLSRQRINHTELSLIDSRALYGQSKIGNVFISNYFAKTHSDVLVSCALHPGSIKTELQRCVSLSRSVNFYSDSNVDPGTQPGGSGSL